jgi:hypothetical protein
MQTIRPTPAFAASIIATAAAGALGNRCRDRKTGYRLAGFLRMNSANNLGSIFSDESAVELALLAQALYNNVCVLINEQKKLVE